MVKPAERAEKLLYARNLKMARSAHAYVRGSTAKFYTWLGESRGQIPEGPPVWICGDCHVGNLGPIADAKGRVAVQIRDLDQTVIGNPAHDLIRLGLSLASAARGSDLPGVTTAKILEHLVVGYETALAGKFDSQREKLFRPSGIQKLLSLSIRRRWRHLAQERLETVEPVIPLGRKFWVLTDEERLALADLFQQAEVREALSRFKGRAPSEPIKLIDAAYWVKGCSSLGRMRYAAMVRIGQGANATVCLVDVKEGVTAAAPRQANAAMPRDNAVRVVTGAKALSPHLGDRMIAARLLGSGVILRELMPQDLKIEVNRLSQPEAMGLAAYLAGVVGRAHGRQMDAETRARWLKEFGKAHTLTLDAPSWLWSSVVDLVSVHEAAYLDHCRRFALAAAA